MKLSILPIGTLAVLMTAHARPSLAQTVSVVPQSETTVQNMFPFGGTSYYNFMGFMYRDIPAFDVKVGDKIRFDLGAMNDADIHRKIYFATANKNPGAVSGDQGIKALSWTKVVDEVQTPLNPRGNTVKGDYELTFTADAPFSFAGGGLIIAFAGEANTSLPYRDPGTDQVLVSATSEDASGKFYGRFYGASHLATDNLDGGGGGTFATDSLAGFIIEASASLAISGFNPTSGPVGTTVTITGTKFTGATGVSFNGKPATSFTVDSDTQITAVVPAGATTGLITVTSPDGSATSTDAFTYSNTAPFVTASIGPAAVKTNGTLTLNVDTLGDLDSDDVTTTYQWKKNGENIPNQTGTSLDLSQGDNGDKGDEISVVVTASDGKTSTKAESNIVTVGNTAPVLSQVRVSPEAPLTNTVLHSFVGVTTDVDILDSITLKFIWKKNGEVIEGENTHSLDLGKVGNGDDGDEITLTVIPNDGTADGEGVTSLPVTIGNRVPTIASVTPQGASDKVGNQRTFSVTVGDDNGASDIKEVWLMINDRLGWESGATLIYRPSAENPTNGQLYLRRGDAFLAPVTIGQGASSSAILDNGSVRLRASDVTVTVSEDGKTLVVNLPVTIRDGLVGTNTVYAYVLDGANASSPDTLPGDRGFARFGSYTVTSQFSGETNVAPTLGKLSPGATNTALNASGIAPGAQTFGFFGTDADGLGDLDTLIFLAGKQRGWVNSATFMYEVRSRRLYLRSDNNQSWLGGIQIGQPGTSGILENSQVRVDLAKVKVVILGDGKSVGLSLPLQAKSGLVGQNKIWLRAQDKNGATAANGDAQGYVLSGTWNVTAPRATTATTAPSNGNS